MASSFRTLIKDPTFMAHFSNISILAIDPSWPADITQEQLEAALSHMAFKPCEPLQTLSIGFTPPRGPHNALVESVSGELIFQVEMEQKSVPGAAIKARVKEMADEIERTTGRVPGRKEKADLKVEALQELLPRAFPKRSRALAWLSRSLKMLVLSNSSNSVSDNLTTALLNGLEKEGLPFIPLRRLNTTMSPETAMVNWLLADETAPFETFTLGRELELKDEESKATVKYGNHLLPLDEVKKHIEEGKRPTRLALTWSDNISFMLTNRLHLKKIDIIGVNSETPQSVADDAFDGDMALETAELSKLLPALIEALGGQVPLDEPKADELQAA